MVLKQGSGHNNRKAEKRTGVEILAPAGSYESFRAALAAGADAVYAGGPAYGARAYARNFTQEQLLEVIDEAHLHGRRFYLTVNTLVKEGEFSGLFSFLSPLYQRGLDAVIVQDIGVFEAIRKYFPDLDIHVSTQMTVTGAGGAGFLKECGAVRVVPARELSLEEIRRMKQETGMEIECFVHGALCYCYSGQCLLSSLIGGRSGNRGQCAQPCRLPYKAGGKSGYLLSPKDICTLELIPDLIEAGIDSFKIEGRMKQPEYVAGVTAMYRKYADLYQQNKGEKFFVEGKDKERLLDLYNRGGFHTGYYHQKNGQEMIALEQSGHAGVPVLQITEKSGRRILCRALSGIHKGDVVGLPMRQDTRAALSADGKKSAASHKKKANRENNRKEKTESNYTFGTDYLKGAQIELLLPEGSCPAPGSILYRFRNQKLLEELQELQKFGKIQEKIYGFLKLIPGKPATLVVCREDISAEASTDVPVEKASKSPLDEARIRRQIEKTGNTEFVFEHLDIEMEEGIFLPMQKLNELRRNALFRLREKLCGQFCREAAPASAAKQEKMTVPAVFCEDTGDQEKGRLSHTGGIQIAVLVQTAAQLKTVCAFPEVSRIYVDSSLDGSLFDAVMPKELLERARQQKTELYLAMPHIFRERTELLFEEKKEIFRQWNFDGVLLRNYESYAYWKRLSGKTVFCEEKECGNEETIGFDKNAVLDHNLYVMNSSAKTFWRRQGIYDFTVPVELNQKEIRQLGAEGMELLVYGYLPVMISAQCVRNTVKGCRGSGEGLLLTDRYQKHFLVEARCRDCYNLIYNTVPLCLFDEKTALEEIAPGRIRLQFSREDAQETKQILQECIQVFRQNAASAAREADSFTRGHFRRGVL